MKTRLAIASVVTVGLSLLLNACGTSAASAQKTYTLGFIQAVNDPYYVSLDAGAKAEAKKLGHIKLIFTGPATVDAAQQSTDLLTLVTQHVSGIAVSALSATGIEPAIKKARAQHIPVIIDGSFIANPHLALSTIGANVYAGGVAAGKLMCQKLQPTGGNVAILEVVEGDLAVELRWNGFRKGLQSCTNVHVTNAYLTGGSESKGAADTVAFLTSNPKDVGIFADNIGDAVAAATGVKLAHVSRHITIIAYDAEPEEVKLLKQGKIAALVSQQPYLAGERVVKAFWNYFHHKSVPNNIEFPAKMVTMQNPSSLKYEYGTKP